MTSVDNFYIYFVNLQFEKKFIYSEKAENFCEISTVDLSYVVPIKSTVAFSEYMKEQARLWLSKLGVDISIGWA